MPALVGLSLIAINIPTTPDPGLVAIVYTGTLLNSTSISPIDVIGPPVTVNVLLVRPTLCTVPVDPVALTVTFPLPALRAIPAPAFNRVTPVFVTVILPLDVIGPPATETPAPAVKLTLVTVPDTTLLDAEVIFP